MLVKGSEVLNKALFYATNYSSGSSYVDMSEYKDTSGNPLWSSVNSSYFSDYNSFNLVPRYRSGIAKSQNDISDWKYSPIFSNFSNTYVYGNCDFVLGVGSTEVSYDDYKIESEVLLNVVGKGWSLNSENNFVLSKTYQNGTSDNITINEVGLIYIISSSTASGSNYQKNVLCSREVLIQPIVLAPNESITISMINNKIGLSR